MATDQIYQGYHNLQHQHQHQHHHHQQQLLLTDQDSSSQINEKISTFTSNSQQQDSYYDVNSRQTFDQYTTVSADQFQDDDQDQIHIDDFHLDSLLLSDILKTCPSFSFFDELINIKSIEQAQTLLHYDLVKINNSILDISTYLGELLLLLQNLDTITNNNSPLNKYYDNIEWIYEGRNEITKISKNVDGIDSIISQLLHIIESKLDESTNDDEFFDNLAKDSVDQLDQLDYEDFVEKNEHDGQHYHGDDGYDEYGHVHGHNCEKKRLEYLHLLSNFDEISDLSLQVKKYLIIYKKRLDISVQYNELYYQILDSVNDEIENCLKDSFKTHELKFSLPLKSVENINITQLSDKIKKILDSLHDISKRKSLATASASNDWRASTANTLQAKLPIPDLLSLEEITAYPIFDDKEQELYDHLSNLKKSIDPINASIDYIKPQISLYSDKDEIKEFYATSIEKMNIKFDTIEEKFIFLINDLDDLRFELVEKRWTDAIQFLIITIQKSTSNITNELLEMGIIQSKDNDQLIVDRNVLVPFEIENQLKSTYSLVKLTEKSFEENLIPKEPLHARFSNEAQSKWEILYNKLPEEWKRDWFGISNQKDTLIQSEQEHSNNSFGNQRSSRNSFLVSDEPQIRALKLRSKRNTFAGNTFSNNPISGGSTNVSPALSHTSAFNNHHHHQQQNQARRAPVRSPSLSSAISPTTADTEFQVRSFSLSRSNTLNHISSFASPELDNGSQAVSLVDNNYINNYSIDNVINNNSNHNNNNNTVNNSNTTTSSNAANTSGEFASTTSRNDSPNIGGNNNGGFGLGISSFNALANNTQQQSQPQPQGESTPNNEKRHIQRRSMTGSLLIGKMNLQPILVQGTPSSPEKDKDKFLNNDKGNSEEEQHDANSKNSAKKITSPRQMKSSAFNGIIPRMGLLGANRDTKVLSTVESVADEDTSSLLYDCNDNSMEIDSPLTKKIQRMSNNTYKKYSSGLPKRYSFTNNSAFASPSPRYGLGFDDLTNISSIENSRLEALQKLENGEEEHVVDRNILDQLNNLTLDDLQKTLKDDEEQKAAAGGTVQPVTTTHTHSTEGRNSGTGSVYSPRSSISRLPVAKSNRPISKRFNITASPTNDSFNEADFHHNEVPIIGPKELTDIEISQKIHSSTNSIASTSSPLARKSSLVPVPAAKVNRIKSPESYSNSSSRPQSPAQPPPQLEGNSQFDTAEAMKTIDRIKKLKKYSVKRSSWIPQPKTTKLAKSANRSSIDSTSSSLKDAPLGFSANTTKVSGKEGDNNRVKHSSNGHGNGNTGSRSSAGKSSGLKPKKRNSNGRAKIIARREFV